MEEKIKTIINELQYSINILEELLEDKNYE